MPSLCTAFHRFVEEIPNFVDTSEVPTNGEETTRYEVIAAPPFDGAVHDTTDDPFAAPVALTAVGAPGTVDGVTAADADEAEPVPDTFVAVTLNVYEVPFVRPVTVQDVVPVEHVNEPGVEVTV